MLHLLPEELLREIGLYLERPTLLSGVLVCKAGRARVVSRLIDLETRKVSVSEPTRLLRSPFHNTQVWVSDRFEIAVRKSAGSRIHVMSNGDRVTVQLNKPATDAVIMVEKPGGILLGPFVIAADQVLDVFFACVIPLDTNDTHIVLATYSSDVVCTCNLIAFHLESGRLHDLSNRIRNTHNSAAFPILTASVKWTGTFWRCALLCSCPSSERVRFLVRVVDFGLKTLDDSTSLMRFVSAHRTFLSLNSGPLYSDSVVVERSQGIVFDTSRSGTMKILIHYTLVPRVSSPPNTPPAELRTVVCVLSLDPSCPQRGTRQSRAHLESWQGILDSCNMPIRPFAGTLSSLHIVDDDTLVFVGSSGGILRIRLLPSSKLHITPLADGSTHPRCNNLCLLHHIVWIKDPNFAEFVQSPHHNFALYPASSSAPATASSAPAFASSAPATASSSAPTAASTADFTAALGLVMLGCTAGDRLTTSQ